MKLLDRLVLKDLLPMFLVGVGMFTSLWFTLGPLMAASRFLSLGFSLAIVVKFLCLSILPVLGLTFPMGMLLAVLLGYGRLSGDSETVALFAGGIPFLRVALPAAVLGLAVSGVGFLLNDPVASYANHQILVIKEDILHNPGDASDQSLDLPPFRKDGVLQALVHVEGGYDAKAQTLKDVTITVFDTKGKPSWLFFAKRARPAQDNFSSHQWQLEDVDANVLGPGGYFGRLAQHHNVLRSGDIGVDTLTQTPQFYTLLAQIKADPDAFPFSQLRRILTQLRAGGYGRNPDVRFAEVHLWFKIALPLASLVFALVAAPLALRAQRTSKLTGWLLSLPIIICYYVLYNVMSSLARGGVCPPVLAAFLPDLIGLAVGGGLVWKRSVS